MLTKSKPIGTLREPAIAKRSDGATIVGHPSFIAQLNGKEQEIPLSAIADSPYQLRKNHTQGIERLKDTLVSHGLLQAIVLRPAGRGRYELLAGHRRCAAARLAGWKQIRARVQEVSDSEAEEIVVIENLQREDLSAIEEARGFQAMLNRPNPPTQEALAERLGVSQAHVANRLRYLRLPAEWQEAIISGEIPHTHARAILPYCDDPRAAAAIASLPAHLFGKKRKQAPAKEEDAQPLAYRDLIDELRRAFTKSGTPMGYHSEHDKKSGQWLRLPKKITDAMRERLDVVEVDLESDYGDRVMQVARNRSAWFEIAREHAQREEERSASRGAPGPRGHGKKKSDKPREEMTAAERKAAAAEEAKNKKKRQEQLARRRREIAADWKRLLIARALADANRTGKEVLMVCLYYQTQDWKMDGWVHGDRCDLDDLAKDVLGCKDGLLADLATGRCHEAKVWDLARHYAARAFADAKGNPMSAIVWDRDLDPLIAWLKIDLAAAWQAEQMGTLSEAWWEAHDKEDLIRIGSGIVNSNMKKGELVGTLASSHAVPFPPEFKPATTGKGRRKPR
jgi:ParB/RepB/Spo0J family partition protein